MPAPAERGVDKARSGSWLQRGDNLFAHHREMARDSAVQSRWRLDMAVGIKHGKAGARAHSTRCPSWGDTKRCGRRQCRGFQGGKDSRTFS